MKFKRFLSMLLAAIMIMSTFVFTSSSIELVTSDDFDSGFMPRNWITMCNYSWDKYDKCIIGYDDANVLESNYGARHNKWWAEGYIAIEFQIRDFDDYLPEHEERTHGVSLWYRDLFENWYNGNNNSGAVYMFNVEVETGKATLTKEHSWTYRDENGVSQNASTNVILAETYIEGGIQIGSYPSYNNAPWYEIGWRITKGKIECYFNGKLIMTAEADPSDTKYGNFTMCSVDETVGSQKSPFLVWNHGNYIALDNFEVWTSNYTPGHTIELVDVTSATCTTDGYTGDYACTDCGEIFEYGETIPATGHTETVTVGYIPATPTENGYSGDTVCKACGTTLEYGEVIPATGWQGNIYINNNFESMDEFTSQFIAGQWYTDDSMLNGWAEAKALQSWYETDDDLGVFKNTAYTWLTYDTSMTLSVEDDDLSETKRFINLVYANDNPKYYGCVEDRIMMSFTYDIQERCFRFTEGWNSTDPELQLMEPVYMEIDTDGNKFFELGISVERGRIRCFYNDQLIFDFVDSADYYAIAKEINSPFLFWQDGNHVQVSNITVADQGYLFPEEPDIPDHPEESIIEFSTEIHPVTEGGTMLTADLYITLSEDVPDINVGQFGLMIDYNNDVMVLADDLTWECSGLCIEGETPNVFPYPVIWLANKESQSFTAGKTLIATMEFSLYSPAQIGDEYMIYLYPDGENDVITFDNSYVYSYDEIYYNDAYAEVTYPNDYHYHDFYPIGNDYPSTCTEYGYSGDFVCIECGEVEYGYYIEPGHTTKIIGYIAPTFTTEGYTGDTVCTKCQKTIKYGKVIPAKSTGRTHINMNFESMDVFTSQFIAGQWYTDDSMLNGWAEAKALQTIYETDDDLGVFKNTAYTWLTYDASITLSVADDDLSETARFINLVYCNDNPKILGRVEDRVMMAFTYDIQERCFRFTEGWNNTYPENQLMEPVYMDIDTDSGDNFITLGISVERGRIRCFYNDQLIFDFVDSADDYAISKEINSCFLFWQDGNFVQISNITVADQGYLFPDASSHKHNIKLIDSVEPTCTTDGYTGDMVCTDCGEVFEEGTVIPAFGHDIEIVGAIDVTCTEAGFTGSKYCHNCNTVIDGGSVIPATGHSNIEIMGAIAATCTDAGFTGTKYCHGCKSVIENGSVIPAAGHIAGEWVTVTEPTETIEGLRTKSCTVCDTKLEREIIPALAPAFTYGDINGDDGINLSDVTILLQHIARWSVEVNTNAADVNADGNINLSDVTLLLQYIAKWDVTLG